VRAFAALPSAGRSIGIIALVAVYHVVGFRAHGWMMRRPWAVFAFVPLGWVIIIAALAMHGVFGMLILGAILQGFIFLPFSWAIATLAFVVLYDYDPKSKQGFVYPGEKEPWGILNTNSVRRGNGIEGHWFHASNAWQSFVEPILNDSASPRH